MNNPVCTTIWIWNWDTLEESAWTLKVSHTSTFWKGLEKKANFRRKIAVSLLLLHLSRASRKKRESSSNQSLSAVVKAHRAATYFWLKFLLKFSKPFLKKVRVFETFKVRVFTGYQEALN